MRRLPPGRICAPVAAAGLVAATALVSPVLTEPASATTVTFTTVGTHTFTVPSGLTSVSVTVEGASGGAQSGAGGQGRVVTHTLPVTPGENLTIHVAGAGGNGSAAVTGGTGGPGYATGGAGGAGGNPLIGSSGGGGGGGGGASAVVRAGAPLVVAGGGGGGGGQGGANPGTGGTGGSAGSAGGTATGVNAGSGGTCCSTTSRNGVGGGSGGGVTAAAGGGGAGGGGYNGASGGGGNGGAAGGTAGLPSGNGGGGAGGQSWVQGLGVVTPAGLNTGNGEVALTFQANTATVLSSSLNPSIEGQPVTFTATVTASPPGGTVPAGTVTFLDGATPLGTATLVDGVATFTTSTLAAGDHPITAVYNGNPDFAGSTSNTVAQAVTPFAPELRLVAGASPVAVGAAGESVAYTFTVTNTGNVTVDSLGLGATPTPPAGPVPPVTCSPGMIDPGGVSTCTGSYTASPADMAGASGEILHTFTATGSDAVFGGPVASNPFSVAVDVRTPQPGWTAIVVNTTNTVELTP